MERVMESRQENIADPEYPMLHTVANISPPHRPSARLLWFGSHEAGHHTKCLKYLTKLVLHPARKKLPRIWGRLPHCRCYKS
jgi:hypothetical protein